MPYKGTIKWAMDGSASTFGIITLEDENKVFFHSNKLRKGERSGLKAKAVVVFDVEQATLINGHQYLVATNINLPTIAYFSKGDQKLPPELSKKLDLQRADLPCERAAREKQKAIEK